MKPLSLYLHIPFCIRKCKYCDFLSFAGTEMQREEYVEMLLSEIALEAPFYREYEVKTIFFGGGTPSLLSGEQMGRIMERLNAAFYVSGDAEISMEVNPGTVTLDNLSAYKAAGINRLSIGLQSAVDEELLALGRIHSYSQFLSTYQAAVGAGFTNINIDLMSALPGQSRESYLRSLRAVLDLTPVPTHVSAYSLIIEEGTPFYNLSVQGQLNLPDEEEERAMYEETLRVLRTAGYDRYEISNYAQPGYECRHNCVYWTRGDYLGLGLGAASLVGEYRWNNERDMGDYRTRLERKEQVKERQQLTLSEQMEEFMFLGLRLTGGVSKKEFKDTFGTDMESVYGQVIDKHVNEGLLVSEERVALTEKGLDVSNYVMADFLLS